MRAYHIAIITLALSGLAVRGEEKVVTIVDHITEGTTNTVTQPGALLKRLCKIVDNTEEEDRTEEPSKPVAGRLAGYRVQVFSDNNVRTAKAEAASKQRVISARFPNIRPMCATPRPTGDSKWATSGLNRKPTPPPRSCARHFPPTAKRYAWYATV